MIDSQTLWISIKTASCATAISSISGLAVAVWMVRQESLLPRRLFILLDTLCLAPLVLPPTVLGFILLLLSGAQSPIGQAWEFVFGQPLVFSWPAAVLAASVVAFPLMYRTSRAALQQVEPQLIAAARTLSSQELRIFFRVVLPIAYPGILAGVLLAFARSLGEFGATLMVAGSIPGVTRTIPMAIYYAVESGDWQEAAIWSALIMILSLLVVFIAEARIGSSSRLPRHRKISKQLPLAKKLIMPRAELLQIDIQKNLQGFPFHVQFTTASLRLAILGPSGSGKSLLLRCIAGLEKPDAGSILAGKRRFFEAQLPDQLTPKQRRVGLLFQNYALFPTMSIRDNISFGMSTLSAEERRQRTDLWLQKIGLKDFGERRAQQLSGGQQQRVALARALAAEPDILLLDEPFTALDTHLRQQMEQQLLQDLATYPGRLLLVTHNIEEAYRLCADVIILEQGRVIRQGPIKEVFADPMSVAAAQLTGCKNIVAVGALHCSQVAIPAWQCSVEISRSFPGFSHLGLRAHHAQISPIPQHEVNSFPAWLARISESPHRLTFFIKLHGPAENTQDSHLQVELLREKAEQLLLSAQPWFVHLPPERLLPLKESNK